MKNSVQPRCVLAILLALAGAPIALAEEAPDAKEILRTVRAAQSGQERTLTGRLRTGSNKVPFELKMSAGEVRWTFQNPPQTLVLRLGEKSSQLEEITPDGHRKVAGSRFSDSVRGSDITYEDLAMQFLYWTDAKVDGDEKIVLTDCWRVVVTPPSARASNYSKARLWIAKENGALMKAEAYGANGKVERTFTVRSGQKTRDGLWILKQMRIETAGRTGIDRSPTYLDIDKEK